MAKVGKWLEKQYVLIGRVKEDGESHRMFLDQNGFVTDSLYEAGLYEGDDAATQALANQKSEGKFIVSPLSFHLRDVKERQSDD